MVGRHQLKPSLQSPRKKKLFDTILLSGAPSIGKRRGGIKKKGLQHDGQTFPLTLELTFAILNLVKSNFLSVLFLRA